MSSPERAAAERIAEEAYTPNTNSCESDFDIELAEQIIRDSYGAGERRWIPVEERFPNKGELVLVYFGNSPAGLYCDAWEYSGSNQYFRKKPSRNPQEDVTHWQPLPAPPKESR